MDPVLALAPAPALALVLALAGCPAIDDLEVDPTAEPVDTSVDGRFCGAAYNACGRAFTPPGCVKYEDSRSRAAATEASDIVAEDRLRMGVI